MECDDWDCGLRFSPSNLLFKTITWLPILGTPFNKARILRTTVLVAVGVDYTLSNVIDNNLVALLFYDTFLVCATSNGLLRSERRVGIVIASQVVKSDVYPHPISYCCSANISRT